MDKFYVYAHSNEKHGVFYVGKGSGNRLFTTGNRNQFWKRIASKHGYAASIIEECADEESAYEREMFWISHYKKLGQCCANFTIGGDGVRVDQRWWGSKISKSLTGIHRKRGEYSKNYKAFADKETLLRLYVDELMSVTDIACRFNVSSTTVWARLLDFGVEIRDIKARGRPVVCNETGQVFESITEAARELGLFRENIRKVLAKKYKQTGGFTFSYKEAK